MDKVGGLPFSFRIKIELSRRLIIERHGGGKIVEFRDYYLRKSSCDTITRDIVIRLEIMRILCNIADFNVVRRDCVILLSKIQAISALLPFLLPFSSRIAYSTISRCPAFIRLALCRFFKFTF